MRRYIIKFYSSRHLLKVRVRVEFQFLVYLLLLNSRGVATGIKLIRIVKAFVNANNRSSPRSCRHQRVTMPQWIILRFRYIKLDSANWINRGGLIGMREKRGRGRFMNDIRVPHVHLVSLRE